MISLGPDVVTAMEPALRREWLVTNGLGGYAAGTVAGIPTRVYHGLRRHLTDAGLGSVSEIFDGDPPFAPQGCPWQAWSVAEFLRTWRSVSGE